jgi:hypothetical protein
MIAADLVADTADGADKRAVRAGIDLATKIVDVDVDHIGDRFRVHAPDLLNDRGARDRTPGLAQQKLQQRIFLGAEVNDAPAAADAMRDAVDLQILKDKHITHGTSAAAQHRMDSGDQFRHREGLENDVVGASIQARDALLDGGGGRKKNEGDVRPALLKSGNELQPRHSRKAQIKENQVEHGIFGKVSESGPRRNHLHGKLILLEHVLEKLSQRRISLGYK